MKSRWTLALLIAAAVCAAAPAWSADAPVIGVVEYNKILADYTEYVKAEEKYQEFFKESQDKLDRAAKNLLLNDAEKQELQDLRDSAALSGEQKERMEELLRLTDQRYKEWDTLRLRPERNDEDEARFQELSDVLKTRNEELQQLKEDLEKDRKTKADELMEPINQKIDDALAEVAKKQKLIAILDKDSVLYGGKDVTANVLAELNKGT